MTKKELLEELENYPDDTPLVTFVDTGYCTYYRKISDIHEIPLKLSDLKGQGSSLSMENVSNVEPENVIKSLVLS